MYEELVAAIREACVVHTDETGWRMGVLSAWLQQKCLAHLLKDLAELEREKRGGAVRFAREVAVVLHAALALRKEKGALAPDCFQQRAREIEARLDALIAPQRQLTDPDNARLAKRLRKQRDRLFRFLYLDGVEATNNAAERKIRPAVVVRKTGGCNKTPTGAKTHSILTSIFTTGRQQGRDLVDFFTTLLQSRSHQDPLPSLLNSVQARPP